MVSEPCSALIVVQQRSSSSSEVDRRGVGSAGEVAVLDSSHTMSGIDWSSPGGQRSPLSLAMAMVTVRLAPLQMVVLWHEGSKPGSNAGG